MALNVSVTFPTLPNPYSWSELYNFVTGITVSISGSVGSSDISAGAITAAKVKPDAYWYAAGVLTGATYAVTLDPALTGYANGVQVVFKADTDNPAAGTNLNVNGLGVKPLYKWNGETPAAGDVQASQIITAV